jgi:tetratricopeptide (TPR) repeat protein
LLPLIPKKALGEPLALIMKKIFVVIILSALCSCEYFKSSEDYNSEAEQLEQEGKYKEAILLLDKAIQKEQKNIYALINRGVDKSFLKDFNGAIDDYSKILEIDENNTLALLNRGNNKQRIEDYQGAIEDYERAIKTKGSEDFYFDKADTPLLNTGYEFDVNMEEIRFERGIARFKIDSLQLAFKDFNFSIDNNHEAAACFYWRGLIFITYGMTKEGCEDLNKSLKLGESHAQDAINIYCEKK